MKPKTIREILGGEFESAFNEQIDKAVADIKELVREAVSEELDPKEHSKEYWNSDPDVLHGWNCCRDEMLKRLGELA